MTSSYRRASPGKSDKMGEEALAAELGSNFKDQLEIFSQKAYSVFILFYCFAFALYFWGLVQLFLGYIKNGLQVFIPHDQYLYIF